MGAEKAREIPRAPEKGLVMQVTGSYLVVLTQSGDFRRVPNVYGRLAVGDEVVLAVAPRTCWSRRALVWAAAAVLLFATGVPGLWQATHPLPVLAYVSMDINPSVEVSVNSRGIVAASWAINDDGKRLLEGTRVDGRPLAQALQTLAMRSADLGFLQDDSTPVILIGATPAQSDGTIPAPVQDKIHEAVVVVQKTVQKLKPAAEVQLIAIADPAIRAKANTLDISSARAMVLATVADKASAGGTGQKFSPKDKAAAIADLAKEMHVQEPVKEILQEAAQRSEDKAEVEKATQKLEEISDELEGLIRPAGEQGSPGSDEKGSEEGSAPAGGEVSGKTGESERSGNGAEGSEHARGGHDKGTHRGSEGDNGDSQPEGEGGD